MIRLACQDRPQEHPLLHTHSNSHSQCNTKSFFRWHRLSCYETERGFSRYGQIPLLKEDDILDEMCISTIHKCHSQMRHTLVQSELEAITCSPSKRGKTRETKTQMFLVLLFFG